MNNLDSIREEINKTDEKIKQLFLHRMGLAKNVAIVKEKTNMPIYRPEREEEIFENITSDITDINEKNLLLSFMKNLMSLSRNVQYKHKFESSDENYYNEELNKQDKKDVFYQGNIGAYSYQTAKEMFNDKNLINTETFDDVFVMVKENKDSFGVIPYENSTAGYVDEVFDLLIQHDLYINYIKIIDVNHCLAAKSGSKFEDILQVYSHIQGIKQCNNYIIKNGFNVNLSTNTAVAASEVKEKDTNSAAAICSIEAAKENGLAILEENISDNKINKTKFLVISQDLFYTEKCNVCSMVISLPHKAGALSDILSVFSAYNVNLTKIYSRPDKNIPWDFLFYIEFSGNLNDINVKALIYQLQQETTFVKILGCYIGEL